MWRTKAAHHLQSRKLASGRITQRRILWKFKNNELYHFHRLESVLSDPISALVVENFNKFLEDHKPDIEAQLKQEIAESVNITSTLEQILYEELQKQGIKHARNQAADAFINSCQAAFHSQLAQTTGATVSHAASTTVETTVGASIAHALSVVIAHEIATAMVHLAHSVAFKAVLKTVILHSVGGIVTAVLVKLIAGHMTAAAAGAFLGPLVLAAGGAYVFIKIITIPETLGKALADNMRGEFRPWTEKALEACFEKFTDPEEMLNSVIKSELDTFLPEILGELKDTKSSPPAYEDVQKNIKKLVNYPFGLAKKWLF